jgi:predicted RNase H-like nuclease (RuvC/YqgF family)
MKHLRSISTVFFSVGATLALSYLLPVALSRTEAAPQSLDFRLSTIERRIDQLQNRIDSLDREQRMQSTQSSNAPNRLNDSVLELQHQQIGQAQQIILLQRQMLEMQKRLDLLTSGEKKQPENDKPAEPAKKTAEPAKKRPSSP